MMDRSAARTMCQMVLLTLLAVGCGRGGGNASLMELQRVRSGAMDVVLLSSRDALHHPKDSFVIEFRSAAGGELVDVGEVRGSATMPMSGAPMMGSLDVKRSATPGRYTADGRFDMAGTWRLTIQWQGQPGTGSITFSGTVQ